ncbi:MAG: hypothetical protein MUC49_07255 [Raineya sp.]|jgi:hypothetical protein|nr:hypothetical protein [Raineya sp.]
MKSSYRFQAVFASMMAIFIAIAYCVYRIGFDLDILAVIKIVGLALFIHLIPNFILRNKTDLNWWEKDAIVTIYALLFAGVLGYFTRFFPFLQWSIWLLVITGIILLFWASKDFMKEYKIAKVLFCCFVAFSLALYFLNENYGKFGYKDSFLEAVSVGSKNYDLGTLDMSYHATLAKMYQTYQVPTTGVDGLVWMHYNTASHWLIGNLSLLLDIPTWLFYNLAYQVIFLSLFFRVLTSLTEDLQKYFSKQRNRPPSFGVNSWQFWLLVVIIFIPVPNNMYMAGLLGYHFVISSPYVIALCFLWAFLATILCFWEKQVKKNVFLFVFLPIMLFIIGFSHVATIVILTACIGYTFLRWTLFKKVSYWCVVLMVIGVLASCYFLTAETTFTGRYHSYEGSWGWFFFFKQHEPQYFNFIVVFYASLYILTILYLKNEKLTLTDILKERKAFWLELIWIAALAGLAPNAILQLYGSTGMYFLGLQKWIIGVFLLAYIPFIKIDILEKKWFFYTKILTVGVVLVIFTGKFFKNMDASLKKNLDVRATIMNKPKIVWKTRYFFTKFFCCQEEWTKIKLLYSNQVQSQINQNEFYQIIKSWEKLDKLPVSTKKESRVYIPYKELKVYTDTTHFEYQEIPMIAPYITGIATLHGLPAPHLLIGAYGYSYYDLSKREKIWKEGYSVEELKQIAKAQNAKYLWIYSFKTKDFEKITL